MTTTCSAIGMGSEGQKVAWWAVRGRDAVVGEEAVCNDLGLLFQAVAVEGLARLQIVGIAAERMAHQRQVEAAVGLGLPDVGHLVDEEGLAPETLGREVLGPAAADG